MSNQTVTPQKLLTLFKDAVDRCESALIVCHEFPDIDAIGSSLALYLALKAQNKEAKVWIHQKLDEPLLFLPHCNEIENKYPSNTHFDTLFVLDSSFISRVAKHEKLPTDSEEIAIVNIDHHPDNTHFGHTNIVRSVSSVGEILTALFYDLKWTITKEMATCLYAAIAFDTGRFAFDNTTSTTLNLASKLVECGTEPYYVSQAMEENKTTEDFQVIKVALDNLTINKSLRLGYTVVPHNSPKSNIVLIDIIRQLKDCDICVVFKEINAHLVKINLRSKTEFDVSLFAQKFNGGGHKKASGIKLNLSLKEATESIISQLEKELTSYKTQN